LEQKYESILREALVSVARIESFGIFLDQGINHLKAKISAQSDVGIDEDVVSPADQKKSLESVQQLQRLRDISRALETLRGGLRTGLNDGDDLYSTEAEDYSGSTGGTGST